MKKLLAIIILNLCFIIPSQADDVRDFQIEGISIGDELKNHFSNSELSKVTKYKFKSPKYIAYEIMKSDVKSGTINFYDNIIIAVNNSNIIEGIGGMMFFPNNIKDCRLEQSKVKSELQNLFKDYKWNTYKKKHRGDPTRKSIVYGEDITIDNKYRVVVQCFEWKNKDLGFTNNLRVTLRTLEYSNFLANEAY